MKPFQLIRTNPALTGNVKLVINENYDLYLESYDSTRVLKQSKFKHYPISKKQYWKEVLNDFFDKTDSSDIFAVKNDDDIYNTITDYKNQYDDTYISGAKTVDDKYYTETFEYSAPLHFTDEIPSNFYIFSIPGMSSDFNDMKSNFNLIKSFDLINSDLGVFLNNIVTDNTKPYTPLYIDTTGYGLSYISGINLNTSGYINSYFDNNFTQENLPIFRLEDYVTTLFEKNNTIYPDIINMKFLFSDNNASEFTVNRYVGLYANKHVLSTITSYKTLPVKDGVRYTKNKFVDINDISVSPFNVIWNDSTNYYVYHEKNYYRVVRSIKNNSYNYSMVDYIGNDISTFVSNTFIKIINNNIIGDILDNNGNPVEFNANSVYVIEILGKEYTLYNSYIKSDYIINADEHTIELTLNGETIIHNITDYIEFKISILEILDMKDFDFDRISTDQAKFEYDKSYEMVENDEPKFYAKNHIDSTLNVYALHGNKYMRLPRVDSNNTPLYLNDMLESTYTQYELYANIDGKFMLYHDGVDFFDYNLNAVSLKQEYVSEEGYIYKTMVNNVEYIITFERNNAIYQEADWGVDGKDVVSYTAKPIDISNIKYQNIPASSEYVSSDETFELSNSLLTKLYDKNQSVTKWGADNSMDIHNYPYRLNYSTDFPLYNSVIPFVNDKSIYTRKDMCFDFFYRKDNPLKTSYDFSSLHLATNVFRKFESDFNKIFENYNINNKGKYNYYSYSVFTQRNANSNAETIFRGLKLSVDAKYSGYKFSTIFATDDISEDLKSGINFIIDDNKKFIVLHLYINTSDTVTINDKNIETCDISEWYSDIYKKDINNLSDGYINTGFKVNNKYINVRPQDFALPNIIQKIINTDYIAYDYKSKDITTFNVDVIYPDAIPVKNRFMSSIIDTPSLLVTNTYDNMNVDGIVTSNELYKDDFLSLTLNQNDNRNLWELGENDITIYRYSAAYRPIFKKVELFVSDSDISNSIFDTDLYNFAKTSELYLHKANIHGSILKTENDESKYPKIDEYGLFVIRKNIFESNASNSAFYMNRRIVKDLSNTKQAGNDGYFDNNSYIEISNRESLYNENNLISQLDYTDYTEFEDVNNLVINIPSLPLILDTLTNKYIFTFNFNVKLIKDTQYTFFIQSTNPNFVDTLKLSSIHNNVSTLVNIQKSMSFFVVTQNISSTNLSDDISFKLTGESNTGGSINIFIGTIGTAGPYFNGVSKTNVYSENYLDIFDEKYAFQFFDNKYNNIFSIKDNISLYTFTDTTTYNELKTVSPGRLDTEKYDDDIYPIPNTWKGLVYFDILNNSFGVNDRVGDELKIKIDGGLYGGAGSPVNYNLATIYHFIEYGSQPKDGNNFDASDYRTYRIGYKAGLSYFYMLSGMNKPASNLYNSYKTFSVETFKNETIPTKNLYAENFLTNVLTTDYTYSIQYGPAKNRATILWDSFYNDTELEFTFNGTNHTINLLLNNGVKKTYTAIGTEIADLLSPYTVTSDRVPVANINSGTNAIPRYSYKIQSQISDYTQNFDISLSSTNDFRIVDKVNLNPTISYNEIGTKNHLKENRYTGRINDLTVEFFVKTNSFNKSFETIFYNGDGTDISYYIGRDDKTNRLLFRTVHEDFYTSSPNLIEDYRLGNKSYTTHDLFSNNFINDGKYHHVACVVDYINRTKTIYIDGKVDISITDYLNSNIPDISTRLACFIANTPRFVGSDIQHTNIQNIYTLAYAMLDIDNLDDVTKRYAEYWKNAILGNYNFEYSDLQFMKNNWKISYNQAFKIFNDNFASMNYSLRVNNTYSLLIGKSLDISMNYFVGNLDQIRVWNYARTQSDIYNFYRYDLANTYTAYDKSLIININFNGTVDDSAIVSKNTYSWFMSKNKKIYRTPSEYSVNNYDNIEQVFVKYDFVEDSYTNTINVFDVKTTISDANIIGYKDEKSATPNRIDNTVISTYKNYYSNNIDIIENINTVPTITNENLIYKL